MTVKSFGTVRLGSQLIVSTRLFFNMIGALSVILHLGKGVFGSTFSANTRWLSVRGSGVSA